MLIQCLGIRNSKAFICCVTKSYYDSENCKREVEYAVTLKKPMVVLMFERLEIESLGGLGFIINPLVRINCYRFPKEWNKEHFDAIYNNLNGTASLNDVTGLKKESPKNKHKKKR